MMENNNDWFENLNYPSIDHQQQTFVTKHDLELLHKKIIATDLIVQKYQEANKALLRLQVENDDLKQQIEQITNECCIFSKQVTECTQECDNLKEQLDLSNSEKRELHQQIRLLQDENTNNYHEIMVLRQYESLKETNDQLTKTVERQQKTLGKLQLQLQRKSPIVYKPIKNKQEPSETDIALTKSQKSVRELKLALGRLVNFIQLSKIEIPTNLHIRPVLKAHEINDDFLEIEGDFIPKPVKQISIPIASQTDDDDDDDNGDFIDINHTIQSSTVNTTIPSEDIIVETPVTSKPTSSRQQKKKKEIPKPKSTKKSRRQKDKSTSENASTKLDDLVNELEIALSQSDQPPISQLSSFLSDDDDDDEDKIHKSDKQQLPYTPLILQSTTIHPELSSTISIEKDITFFSDDDDDDNEEISQQKLLPYTPIIEQQSSINEQNISSLQVDSIVPMEIETSDKRTKYMSFLSEDNDNDLVSSLSTQEYISPLELNRPFFNDNNHKSQLSDKPSLLLTTEDSSSNKQIETISKNIQDSLLNKKHQSPVLNSNHVKIVLRLLNTLTQIPETLKPLRLVHRRTQQNNIPEEQVIVSIEKLDAPITEILEHLAPEQPKFIEEVNTTTNDVSEIQFSLQMEDQLKSVEEIDTSMDEIAKLQTSLQVEEQPEVTEEIHMMINERPAVQVSLQMEDQSKSAEEMDTTINEIPKPQSPLQVEEQPEVTEEIHMMINERPEVQLSLPMKDQSKSVEEINTAINEIPEPQSSLQVEEQPEVAEEIHMMINKIPEEQPKSKDEIIDNQLNEKLETSTKDNCFDVIPKQSLLKPFQISIISQLLNTLTSLPIKPLILPIKPPVQKRKQQKSVIKKPSISLSRQTSNRISRSPPRMQTRSLNSIRACIARCNQPIKETKKRTTTELISPSSTSKRMKSKKIEENKDLYDLINKFLNSFSKEINDELKTILEEKLQEDISLLNDNIYRIISELMINKCDILLPLIKHLHPYEESIKILLEYINSKSSIFQQYFIKKLNQTFEYETKQQQISNDRIKILNRLFIHTCSIFASSSVIIYARLFDIGYYFSHDILINALSFISNIYSSLISIDSQTNSSNILLHQILFDLFQSNKFNITNEYLENLFISYQKYTHDEEDLIRCFILISRHQSWLWCSNELCLKILFPLLNKINNKSQQHRIILIILQFILFIYKDNEDFKRDIIFHDQLKQLLLSLKTMNREECTVRDKIFSILQTCS